MKSIPLDNATRRLGAPKEWDHERDGICHTLDILDTDDGFMLSLWEPTPNERARLAAGAPLLLYIQGRSHPVVGLDVGEPAETSGTRAPTDPEADR